MTALFSLENTKQNDIDWCVQLPCSNLPQRLKWPQQHVLSVQFSELDFFLYYIFCCYNLVIQHLALGVSCGNVHGYNMNQSQGKCSQLTSVVTLHGKQLRRIKILSLLFRLHWHMSTFGSCAGPYRYRILSPWQIDSPREVESTWPARVSGMLVSHESQTGVRKGVLDWLCLVIFWCEYNLKQSLKCISNSQQRMHFAEFLEMWNLLSQASPTVSSTLWREGYWQERSKNTRLWGDGETKCLHSKIWGPEFDPHVAMVVHL